jgi:peptidoglycan/LPS O-acetylase OafA/YrhL
MTLRDMDAPAKPHILAIDLVRFVCALLVVAHHFGAMLPINPPIFLPAAAPDTVLARDWAWWSWSGWVGVEIFFVVSGYVIAMSGASGTGSNFLCRRVLRLAPAAWACATMTAIVLMVTGLLPAGTVAARWLTSMTFWPIATQIDGSYWSLGIEVAFYLLIATQLGGRTANARAIERVGAWLAVLSGIYWILALTYGAPSGRSIDLILLPYGGCFAAGIALWAIRDDGPTWARGATLVGGVAAAIVEIMSQASFMAHGLGLNAGPAVPIAIFVAAVLCIAAADRLERPLARWIGARRLGFVGLVTYPLYLIHQYVGAVLITALRRIGVPSHIAMVLAAITVLAIAAIVARAIEPGLRRWLAGRLSRAGRAPISGRRGPVQDTLPSASPPAG